MSRSDRGLTLLQVVVASAILAVVLALAYAVLASAVRLSDSEIALRDRQFQLHHVEDFLAAEMRESSPALIRVTNFTDTAMPTSGQTVLTIVSARDAANVFQVLNAAPIWQKLIVYAPYWNATLRAGELRRYEISPVPAAFSDPTQSPTILVDSTTLTLAGSAVARYGGQSMLSGVDFFQAAIAANEVTLNVSLRGSPILDQASVNLQTGVSGRN